MATHIAPGAKIGSVMMRLRANMKTAPSMCGGPSSGNFRIGVARVSTCSDANLDPHAPVPLDASRAALPLPAQLTSSRSFGHAPHRRFRDCERGAPAPEDILASRLRSRSPGRPAPELRADLPVLPKKSVSPLRGVCVCRVPDLPWNQSFELHAGAHGILPCATKLRLQMGRELGRQLLYLLVVQSAFGPPFNRCCLSWPC